MPLPFYYISIKKGGIFDDLRLDYVVVFCLESKIDDLVYYFFNWLRFNLFIGFVLLGCVIDLTLEFADGFLF